MSVQIAATPNADGEDLDSNFDFEQFIIKNELDSVKDLLVKHNATKPSTLKTSSTQFQSLMSDPQLFMKSQMIPKILKAVSTIEIRYKNNMYIDIFVDIKYK